MLTLRKNANSLYLKQFSIFRHYFVVRTHNWYKSAFRFLFHMSKHLYLFTSARIISKLGCNSIVSGKHYRTILSKWSELCIYLYFIWVVFYVALKGKQKRKYILFSDNACHCENQGHIMDYIVQPKSVCFYRNRLKWELFRIVRLTWNT